jgi:hypothetical protein
MDGDDIFVIQCFGCGLFGSDSLTVGHISEAWFVEKEDLQFLQEALEEAAYRSCCGAVDLKIVRYKKKDSRMDRYGDKEQYVLWEDHVKYVYEFSKMTFEEKRDLEIKVEDLKGELEELQAQLRRIMDEKIKGDDDVL